MAFSPVARFRNFTLENLKALLEVYPDEARAMSWDEAAGEIEVVSPGYKEPHTSRHASLDWKTGEATVSGYIIICLRLMR